MEKRKNEKIINPNTLGDRLRKARNAKRLTMDKASELVGIQSQQLRRYEYNENLPNLDTLIGLCKLYDVSADYLLCMDVHRKSSELQKLNSELTECVSSYSIEKQTEIFNTLLTLLKLLFNLSH